MLVPEITQINGWVTYLTTPLLLLIGLGQVLTNKWSTDRAAKIKEALESHKDHIRSDLKIAESAYTNKLDEIHVLVNSDHGILLGLFANALQRVADLTRRSEDQSAADDAKRASIGHDAAQKVVDENRKKQFIEVPVSSLPISSLPKVKK